ncbi:MAG: hypothetical protein IKO47_07075 [Ruminococcus sp.]|nr:hypothetical protein [Ruminococcus sp.]
MRARFHLPDFTRHFTFNLIFAEMLKNCPQYFREGVEIASVYGAFPPAIWNGGRFQYGQCDKSFIKQVITEFNRRGIPLRFTFTNPMLEKKHLSDKFCNMIMHYADNGLNEVIVASPLLEEYIRKNYPSYKLTSSTCKRITDPDKLYDEIDKDYHIVVIDYDLNNKFDILEKIQDKKKCELLVNACCNPGCKRRSDHYKSIGVEQLVYADYLKSGSSEDFDFTVDPKFDKYVDKSLTECPCMKRTLFEIKDLSTHISPDDIWEKYIPMGFEQFKIEGRTIELFNLVEHYMYYMIKPELRDEARLMLYVQLVRQGVIKTEF